ncbi:unnamed protein product [Paramecium sonneborni]|uniref:Uncharacterized protein n=1 Tax=Paramecium sonneborni TaxID=65129 RepID=A0A8S1QYE2_9CILI|nr:unnamed protein product [Paramecium sonneborni]
MKTILKQQTIITLARPCSINKEITPISIHSPDRQLVYGLKTQQQARVQTYVGSPYVQSPTYDANKKIISSPNIQPQSPKHLTDSFHQKQKTLDFKPTQTDHSKQFQGVEQKQFETTKQLVSQINQHDFAKTYQYDLNKENKELNLNTDRRTFNNPFLESKENIKVGLEFLSRSPIQELANQQNIGKIIQPSKLSPTQTSSLKSKLQNDINKISNSLRELISSIQKQLGTSNLTDVLNDQMIDVLSNFRKLEETIISDNHNQQFNQVNNYNNQFENEQKIQSLTEDYNKLKGILEQLQTKMASLVQENQKLNKNLIDQEQQVIDEKKRLKEENQRLQQNQCELNRVLGCLQLNQKENEELRNQLQKLEKNISDSVVCRQLFQQDEYSKEFQIKYQNLLKEFNQLEQKYKQMIQERSIREMNKSPSILRSPSGTPHQQQNKQAEQLELKLLQFQIENDNLKAEMAHNQVDSKQLDQKNSVIAQLEEKIRSILRERTESEDHLQQICYNLENQIEQFKTNLNQKDSELSQMIKLKKEIERDFQSSVKNYQIVQKGLDDKLINVKADYDKLLGDFKLLDQKRIKTEENLKSCEKSLEQQKQESTQLLADKSKLQDKLQNQQKQIDQLSQQLQQYQQSTQQLLKQLDSLKQIESQQKLDLDQIQNELRQIKQDAKNQINDLNQALALQIQKTKEKEKQNIDLVEEMSALKDQYEVQKKIQQENINELERKSKNLKNQLEETIENKENEINDLKINMEQQLKMMDKRNAISYFDFDQREQQWMQDLQQKTEIIEALKGELEKTRSINYNIQEDCLKNNIQNTQLQATINNLKGELNQAKQEQAHLIDMLKKRKEETEQLHQGLEEARKEVQIKKNSVEDNRRSLLRQQDLQVTLENLQRDNLTLTQKINALNNELQRKQREHQEKSEEYLILKRKYDETIQNLERLEKRWGDKIDQHRKN